jgi:hypothetical protein
MRLELLDHEDSQRTIGAIVVTKDGTDTVSIDAGPADGLPLVRIKVTRAQALQLSANLRAVANGRDEEVLLGDQ